MPNLIGNEIGITFKVAGPFRVHESDRRRAPWISRSHRGPTFEECITRITLAQKPVETREGVRRIKGGK